MKGLYSIILALIILPMSSHGQLRKFLKSDQCEVITSFIEVHAFSIRTDYVLKTKGGTFGRDNQDFFSFAESEAFLLNSGYFVGSSKLLLPWSSDEAFKEYQSKPEISPELSTVYLQRPGEDSYSIIECDTMFISEGLSYIKVKDTSLVQRLNVSSLDSLNESDWMYSHRLLMINDSVRVDNKIHDVGGYESSGTFTSLLALGSQINESTLSRDVFLFDTEIKESALQFSLIGYIDEDNDFHRVVDHTPKPILAEIVIPEVDSSLSKITIIHKEGFPLANVRFKVNGSDKITDENGVLWINRDEGIEINGFQVQIEKDQDQVIFYYHDGIFTPIKKKRRK